MAAHDEAKKLETQLRKLYERHNAPVAACVLLSQRASKALQSNLGKTRLRYMGGDTASR